MPSRTTLALVGITAASAVVALAAPASADPGFTPNTTDDIVAVGSDTTMLALDHVADGATVGGVSVPGYNAGKTSGRLASWDAQLPTNTTTISLRSGLAQIARPNGSGAGKALLYGAGNNTAVSFARSSSSLNAAETEAGLRQYPFALDVLEMATAKTTNAPASLSLTDIVRIYKGEVTNWSQIGGKPGAIVPLIPQSGSGTRSFFEAQLKAANGGAAVTLGSGVRETQEHSDVDVKANANAVAPFSTGRARLAGTVKLLDGWSAKRAVYNVVRGSDASKFDALLGSTGFICSPQAKLLIEAGGLDQLATPANGGVCGESTTTATSNFTTNDVSVQTTTTRLTGTSPTGATLALTATVTAGGKAATGTVEFWEGTTKLGTAVPVQGVAKLSVGGQRTGTHKVTARYIPATGSSFTASSATASVIAKAATNVQFTGKQNITTATTPRWDVLVRRSYSRTILTGSVKVQRNGVTLKTYTLRGGKATVTLPKQKKGRYTIKLAYGGDKFSHPSSKSFTLNVK